MTIKTVETIRKIRDQHYEEIKDFSVKDQIEFIKKKAEQLKMALKIDSHFASKT
ncbi:MAG: hypothetical protein HQK91_14365 [Nitrospirae bacterium]|nr:hypothetical protein [Nitrospirota bacterium]MBF0542622.1 hypothetical protein [Nitrospirota bacterium]